MRRSRQDAEDGNGSVYPEVGAGNGGAHDVAGFLGLSRLSVLV